TRLSSDVVAVAHASYVAELVGALLPAEAPDAHALEVICALWDSLAAHGPSPGALRAVELALLDLAGHKPAIDHCAACGETALESNAVFDPARGGAICRRCAASSRGLGIRPLDPQTRAYLREVIALDMPAAARAVDTDDRFTTADRHAARDAMLGMVTSLVGRPLRSLEYIAKLGAAAGRGGTR
ncbi:MAG TPA: DNA repair protein RecO, partial [Kofleriaceae bacterium]|nr:DNA repair protein RecO [Kofleriaceae bacterium]